MVEAMGAITDCGPFNTVDWAAMAVRIAGSRACIATASAWSRPQGSPNAVGTSASAIVTSTAAIDRAAGREAESGDACCSSFSLSR